MMSDTGGGAGGEEVVRGRPEELHHRGVIEARTVRHVDNYGGTLHGVGQALARHGVNARAT